MTSSVHPFAYSYIRFSTPEQQYGDSLRRQMDSSIEYAAKHGLTLDTTLNLRDLGISAFRGANVEKGRLGAFIKAIDEGLVAKGSYLLVESLDRLSRAEVMDALEVFLAIVNREVTIVTLLDGRLYSRDSLRENSTELIISIVIMSRAYDESVTKSKRRRKTWNQSKRVAETAGAKITKKLPFWLSLPDPAGEFVVDPEAAALVRRVFELAKAGCGYWKISQMLNAEGVQSPAARSYNKEPKHGVPRTWATSSIGYLLKNEAVIGNLVMAEATLEEDEAPVPQRIDSYYPQIIDDELYYAVLGKRHAPKGRASLLKTNLFTGLLYCGYCQGPMQVDSNTKNEKRRSSICCQRKRRTKMCISTNWSYDKFEEDFFKFVHEVDVASIVDPRSDTRSLEEEIDALEGRLIKKNRQLARLVRTIAGDGEEEKAEEDVPMETIKAHIRALERDCLPLKSELHRKQVQLDGKRSYTARAEREIVSIRKLFADLNGLQPEERVLLRYKIAEHIASVVRSIHLYPDGNDLQLINVQTMEPTPRDTEPNFRVEFQNGFTGFVTPSRKTSSRFNLTKKPMPIQAR